MNRVFVVSLAFLVSKALANGCHYWADSIGCPTLMDPNVISTRVAQYCASPPISAVAAGKSAPYYSISSPDTPDYYGNAVETWSK